MKRCNPVKWGQVTDWCDLHSDSPAREPCLANDSALRSDPSGLHTIHKGSRPITPREPEEEKMFKSSRRDKAEGRLERLAGRLLELVGRGSAKKKVKGKAARTRGSAKNQRGRAKQRVGR